MFQTNHEQAFDAFSGYTSIVNIKKKKLMTFMDYLKNLIYNILVSGGS